MDISVVIPLYNEEESIPELYAWIERVMNENKFSYEVIFISDGSTDRSWDIICELTMDGHGLSSPGMTIPESINMVRIIRCRQENGITWCLCWIRARR